MPEITIASRIRTSPFYDATLDAGVASFTVYNHMFMPSGYGDPEAEYRRLTEGVALWDVAVERQVEIAGPDAAALSQFVSARDLTGLRVGRARYAPMCDHDGRLVNDPVVLRVDDDRYWFSLADSDVLMWVRALAGLRGDDVEVSEPDVSPLAIQGPLANDLASDLFGRELIDSLGFFHHARVDLDGIPMVICRSGWSKQGGFELFLTDGSRGVELWDRVMDAGAAYGIGPGAPNSQERIESGLLSFGSDHDADTDPLEAGLGAYTSLEAGIDFCGKTALIDRTRRGTRRPIVNVTIDGEFEPTTRPWVALVDGDAVGELRSAVWSPRLDAWIGLAQLATPHHEPGSTIATRTESGVDVHATVTDEPFGTIRTH